MNTITLIGSFAIVGAVVTTIVEYTKGFLQRKGHRTVYMVLISLVIGLIVYFFHLIPTSIIATLVGVLTAANSVYILVMQYLNTGQASAPQV